MRTPEIWTLPLRVVTPAFVGGSEPNDVAEVRVPSIRGALRAWYRLLVGPDVASGLPGDAASALRESVLFGGAGDTWGQSIASLSLEELPPQGFNQIQLRRPGIKYLGFSLRMGDNDRRYVAPGTEFSLRLVFPRGVADQDAELFFATLWSWVAFGGLGSRSRRGFGSLDWAGPATFTDLHGTERSRGWASADTPPDGPGSLAEWFSDGLRQVRTRVKEALAPLAALENHKPIVLGAFDEGSRIRDIDTGPAYHFHFGEGGVEHNGRSRVCVWAGGSQGWNSAEDAAEAIGLRFSEFRRERGVDGLNESPLHTLERRDSPTRAPDRAAFGLPLTLQNVRKRGPRFELRPLYQPHDGERDANSRPNDSRHSGRGSGRERIEGSRAPSPLLLRIAPVGRRHVVVLTLLSGPWPGRDYDVRESRQPHAYMPANDGNTLPARFLDSLPQGLEVRQ